MKLDRAAQPPSTPADCECDVLVIGSGVGGLSAALTAGLRGLQTIVAEKADVYGGTSIWSGGWIWIPCNDMAQRDEVDDSLDKARLYLRERLGPQYDPALVDAYLEAGPRMLREYARETPVQFEPAGYIFPDYHPETPGSLHGAGQSRSLRPVAFNGRQLSRDTARNMRPMLRQLTLSGMLIGSLVEAQHFINASRSLTSARYVLRKTLRYIADRIRYGRDMSLVNGMALIARHVSGLERLGVPIWVGAPAVELIVEGGEVRGAVLEQRGKRIHVRTNRGVVLACGGFPHDEQRKSKFYSHVAAGAQHYGIAPPTNTGDGLTLGERAGGSVVEGRPWNCLFMPASRIPGTSVIPAVFPHIWDRSKPGFIAVTPDGRRFVNEAAPYMMFGQAMVDASQGKADVRAWLICDHAAIHRYGLGLARPMLPLWPHLRSGYLVSGPTIDDLARRIAVPEETLRTTIAEYNEDARRGVDTKFGKGADPFSRFQGDPDVKPNPNMAPLAQGPYFAVEIFCADFGTFTGLRTNAHAQVLDRETGEPIRGLYAAGNDMAMMMGSHSVGGGITLGPAMVFGYIAACHLAARSSLDEAAHCA
ncbi:MAG: FAD-dependent oxidoreductase [Rubrivivax sp.]|nr:FAD-dependent oxidoreductase [Rubrivivax sp.]